jgi:hypothetical protein
MQCLVSSPLSPIPSIGTAVSTPSPGTSISVELTRSPRRCQRCLRDKPAVQFRVVNKATQRRAGYCNECHRITEKSRRSASRTKCRNQRLFTAWGFLARATARRRSIERLCLHLIAQFGSEQKLALAWQDAFQEASACRRIRAMAALVELLRWTEANPESFRQLTDEELAAEFARELAS